MKIHSRHNRLYCNAGMNFPLCYGQSKGLLDTDKGRLKSVSDINMVTCKQCLNIVNKRG